MALSDDLRTRLIVALTSPAAGKEVADAVDAAAPLAGNNTLSGNNTFSGNNTLSGTNSFTGANTFTGALDTKRIKSSQGTAVVAGDFALSGGFGSTASVAVTTGSNDSRGQITVTSAGTGQGASPTVTLTFKDGTWTSAPFAVVCRSGGSQRTVPVDVTTTATTMVITLLGTPVAAETYLISYSVRG